MTQFKIKNTFKRDCPVCTGNVELDYTELEVESVGDAQLVDIRNLSDLEILNLNFSQKIVLSCQRGIRSRKVAENLRLQGHSLVYSLKGGVDRLV